MLLQPMADLPLLWAQSLRKRGSSTTGLAYSGLSAVACAPALGRRRMTPPRRASGQRPAASTALKRSAVQTQTAAGHCLKRPTPQQSWPGALERATRRTALLSSSASNLRTAQLGAALGGTTLAQQGPRACCQSGYHACSLAASKAA